MHQRIDLLTRDDCRNATRSFNLDGAIRKYSDDATSVKIWIEEMATLNDENPVLCHYVHLSKIQGVRVGGHYLQNRMQLPKSH